MIIHERRISKILLYYRALSRRMNLNPEEQKVYEIHERGYQGELTYDKVYDEILNHLYIFRGIYLNIENSTIQCDALIISDNGFIVHEIKNYSGNYKYENEKWYVRNFEISDEPLAQLKRTMSRLIKLRYANNVNFSIDGKLVFPHIEFTLTSAHEKIWDYTIMRSQLKRHFMSFKDLHVSFTAEQLVEIIKAHIVEDPYFDMVADFDKLKKGVYCRACGSYDMTKSNVHFKCNECTHRDTIHTVILNAIAELNTLFHTQPITRNKLWLLLDRQVCRSTISRIIGKYCYKLCGGSSSSYQFKYYDFQEAYQSETRLWRFRDSPVNHLN